MHWSSQNHLHTNFTPSASEGFFSIFPGSSTVFLFCEKFSLLDQPRDLYFWSAKIPMQNTSVATTWMGSSLWSFSYLLQVDRDFVWFYLCLFHEGCLLQLYRKARDELGYHQLIGLPCFTAGLVFVSELLLTKALSLAWGRVRSAFHSTGIVGSTSSLRKYFSVLVQVSLGRVPTSVTCRKGKTG